MAGTPTIPSFVNGFQTPFTQLCHLWAVTVLLSLSLLLILHLLELEFSILLPKEALALPLPQAPSQEGRGVESSRVG